MRRFPTSSVRSHFSAPLLLGLTASAICMGCARDSAQDGGQAADAIIGGGTVSSASAAAKYTVAVLVDHSDEGPLFCTGSILDVDLVVTAAHCIKECVMGQEIRFGIDAGTSMVRRPVDMMFRPADFNPSYAATEHVPKNNDDIAVLHFTGGLPAGFSPAPLPTVGLTFGTSQKVTQFGFGIDEDPNGKDASDPLGAGILRTASYVLSATTYAATELQTLELGSKLAASGDSGGPLYASFHGASLLVGVDNWGDYHPNVEVYARVDAHLTWLRGIAALVHGVTCAAPNSAATTLCAPGGAAAPGGDGAATCAGTACPRSVPPNTCGSGDDSSGDGAASTNQN